MPGYRPIATQYLHSANVLIRLTPTDSLALMGRLQDAIARKTGVNLVFMGMDNAFSLTTSDEEGEQIKCIAYKRSGFRVNSPMKGYNGPWSHVEIVMPLRSTNLIRTFLAKIEGQKQETLWMTHS
ncbi:hypothetical protein [Candidatus Magnetobacterium casense]|uniref:Uncharacterized protein n=1 Tax=Candidatus Magnetobacterium casense TaxID=1455061 RepID=A0ABS6S2Z4_9BACT|nr:hypothetical protein [Candidatus Magnetobacterium casensis]MBV6343212.1 hypothetical protein [Candidatus Magnetobacterium casensis]